MDSPYHKSSETELERWLNSTVPWLYRQFSGRVKEASALDPSGSLLILVTGFLVGGYALQLIIAVFFKQTWNRIKEKSLESQRQMIKAVESAKRKAFEARELAVSAQRNLGMKFDQASVKEMIVFRANREGFVEQMLSTAYLSRLAAAVAFFAVASYLNTLAAVIAGWRTPNIILLDLDGKQLELRTLPDIGHDFLDWVGAMYLSSPPTPSDWYWLPDWFIGNVGITMVLFSLLHPKRLLIIRRVTAIFGFVNLLRAMTVAMTSLPDASPRCYTQFNNPATGAYKSRPIFPAAFYRALKVMLNPAVHITCGDMVFSGHTVFLVLCCAVLHTYCRKEQLSTPFTRALPIVYYLRYVVYLGSACGVFAIIGTRLHYSIDVFLAIYITSTCWIMYHRALPFYGQERGDRERMWSVLQWLEHDDVNYVDYKAYRLAMCHSGDIDDKID